MKLMNFSEKMSYWFRKQWRLGSGIEITICSVAFITFIIGFFVHRTLSSDENSYVENSGKVVIGKGEVVAEPRKMAVVKSPVVAPLPLRRTRTSPEEYFIIKERWIQSVSEDMILVSLYCTERVKRDRVVFSFRTPRGYTQKMRSLKSVTTRSPGLFKLAGTEIFQGEIYTRFVIADPTFRFSGGK